MPKPANVRSIAIPRPATEAEARRFEDLVEAKQSAVAGQAPPVLPTSGLRRADRGQRLAVYLPAELEAELRVRCARERRSLSDAVTAAVQMWIQG